MDPPESPTTVPPHSSTYDIPPPSRFPLSKHSHPKRKTPTSKPHQSHKRHHEPTLLAGLQNPFVPHRHNSVWLSQKLISFSQRRNDALGRLQKLALNNFHTDPVFNVTNEIRTSKKIVIAAYFNFFNELFFFGTLEDYVKVVVDNEPYDAGREGVLEFVDVKKGKGVLGKLIAGKSKSQDPEKKTKPLLIVLYKHHPSITSRYERLRLYLGTLLHQMLHAFFHLFSCDYGDCYGSFSAVGSGHGVAWQDAAVAIERAVRDDTFINLDLKVGRERGLVVELDRSGVRVDEVRDEMGRWDMEGKEVHKLRKEGRRGWCTFNTK